MCDRSNVYALQSKVSVKSFIQGKLSVVADLPNAEGALGQRRRLWANIVLNNIITAAHCECYICAGIWCMRGVMRGVTRCVMRAIS